jgi:hypothetical protein
VRLPDAAVPIGAEVTGRGRRARRATLVLCAVLAVLASACSDDDEPARAQGSSGSTSVAPGDSTTTAPERPAGPAADLTEELTGGNGPFIGAASPANTGSAYVEHEYVASGTATAYNANGPLSGDGEWTFEPAESAAYRTRVLVRRPAEAGDFSGTVVVEWLNVSGGLDGNPDYATLEEELVRQGHAWVGVSAQLIGIEGGPVLVLAPGAEGLAGKGLKALDPERYGTLEHPGDGYSFDIFTQVARAVRAGDAMGDLEPERVLAAGESQSALALTTYYNGVQPLTRAFDGFFVHSRASVPLPLVGPGEYADLAGGIGAEPTILRTDLDEPVLELQAEGDVSGVLDSAAARQDDSDTFRLWEVAGTAHADRHLVSSTIADALDCGAPINDGPLHVVAKAALRGLDEWVRTGEPPAVAPRLELSSGDAPEIARDADGIALGGIRTPPVDVPVDVLSGEPGPNPDLLCILLGSTTPLPAERLAELYPSRAEYEERYEAATDEVIDAGFVLEDDREALLAFADASRIAG